MARRDVVIIILILLSVAGIIYFRQRTKPQEEMRVPETLSSTTEQTLEQKFNLEIPDDVEKAELKDVSGGNASAIATRKFENNKFDQSLIADLPESEVGSFYQVWLYNGKLGELNTGVQNPEMRSAGKLRTTKAGWLLDYSSSQNLTNLNQVAVTKEKVDDNNPETQILEGSF
jgi:hypothetical protein